MQALEFQGSEGLIDFLDDAVRLGDVDDITATIKKGLCRLIRAGEFTLPDCVSEPCQETYARRLMYRSEELGYTVVAMTWGPGQGTPLHDHDGQWCVEAVCHGEISVQQYELLEQRDGRFWFEACDVIQAGVGTAGCLIPPHEYHRIFNTSKKDYAVSLHIYSGDMDHCKVYEPGADDWFECECKSLSYY